MTNLEITNAYVGDTQAEKIYLGTDIVWGGGEPGPDYSTMPLTFNIISGGTTTWRATSTAYTKEIQYSINDGPWVSITSTTAGTPISLNTGDIVKFQGDGAISTGQNTTNRFRDSDIVFEVYGNIMSLIDSTGYTTATTAADHSFRQLFAYQSGLTSAENLILPATTIGTNVYKEMFRGCTSLTTAPALPAETLAQSCYNGMFAGCTSLTTAPELPATILAGECYSNMFNGCTSLTTAPTLPAMTLEQRCYQGMFSGCTSLNHIVCLATDITASNYTNNWVNGVASSGTFVKDPIATWPTGNNGIPNGWFVIDAE